MNGLWKMAAVIVGASTLGFSLAMSLVISPIRDDIKDLRVLKASVLLVEKVEEEFRCSQLDATPLV